VVGACCLQVLGKNHAIKGLDKCDFTPMYEHFMADREAKKGMSKEVGGPAWLAGCRGVWVTAPLERGRRPCGAGRVLGRSCSWP
jgi:hypothetical protein